MEYGIKKKTLHVAAAFFAATILSALCALAFFAHPSTAYAGVTSQADVDACIAQAQAGVDAADAEDARLVGLMDDLCAAYDEYYSASGVLRTVAAERAEVAAQLASPVADRTIAGCMVLFARDVVLTVRFAGERAAIQEQIDACNEAADAIRACCTDMRWGDNAAGEALAMVDDSVGGIDATRAQLAEIQAVHRSDRMAALDLAGEWRDILDELDGKKGATGALVFGTGADFSLPKEEFVAKWGAAIDAFYEDYSETVGQRVPLCGYGEAMARAAWMWKVDPRLCAAVSIQESSGGLYCIRPYNAWGWGAADRDPYGLAYEWASWEDAISAWHEEIAGNTEGMAEARSVEALGEVYATDPGWPGHVSDYLEQVGSHCEDTTSEGRKG